MSIENHPPPPRELPGDALAWIDEQLRMHGNRRTGPPAEARVRSWATVVAIPTDRGTAWFKAASRVTAHEARLYPLLVAEAPDLVLHPIASDAERAWMLLPDGGTSMHHMVTGEDLVSRLVEIVPAYAGLQRRLSGHLAALTEMGVPDRQPGMLPGLFDAVTAACEQLVHANGTAEDRATLERVRAMRPRYVEWCDELARSPIAPSLDHSDLHANNILLPDGIDGPGLIYDWGDSVIGHPFSTLLVMLRALGDQVGAGPDDPRLSRVRDAYLEPFTDAAGRTELLQLLDLACWTSMITRAFTWVQVLELGPPADPDWAMAPFAWMKTLLNDSWFD